MVMKGTPKVKVGKWRTHKEPMRVVSGPIGKEKLHFEAPPSKIVPKEMTAFINWFNETAPCEKNEINKAVVRSAIVHLYFETIHPFEDGNGRVGRALSEKALSQGIGRPVLMSLSKTIEANKKDYYEALKEGQRSNEVTPWVAYFATMVLTAQTQAVDEIDFTLRKAKFFDKFQNRLNERQLKIIKRMLEEGPKGFAGGMSAKKHIAITQTSKPTATRDLQDLVEKGIFTISGGGRNTRYEINM
jgi:Fic family protein